MEEFGKVQTSVSYKKIVFGFLVFSLVFIGLIFHFTFSRAEIIISPKEIQKTVSLKVKIDKNSETAKIAQKILPGTIIEIEKSDEKTFKTQSTTEIDDYAKGEVTIYNKRETPQPLYQKSQLAPFEKTSPVFLIDKRVVIPAEGEIKVSITAREKGPAGNIGPTKFNFLKLSSWMRQRIWAESFTSTSGGTKEAKIITQKDIEKAQEKLAQELWDESFKEIENRLKEGEKMTQQTVINEITEAKCKTKPDTLKEDFLVKVKTKTQGVGVPEDTLLLLAITHLKKEGAADEEFENHQPETFSYKVAEINQKEGFAFIEVWLGGIFIPKLSTKVFDKDKIVGMSEREIEKYFSGFENIGEVKVNFWPFWVKNVPGLKKNISIEIKN